MFPNQRNVRMEKNGIVDKQNHLSPSNPKIPNPALSIPLNAQLGEILWLWNMGQHGTTIKWKIFSILPSAAPKIPSSVDTTKYPAWSLFVDIPWLLGFRTAWDHYKMENHPKKYPAAPKIPSSVNTTKYPAWSLLSTGLGFCT